MKSLLVSDEESTIAISKYLFDLSLILSIVLTIVVILGYLIYEIESFISKRFDFYDDDPIPNFLLKKSYKLRKVKNYKLPCYILMGIPYGLIVLLDKPFIFDKINQLDTIILSDKYYIGVLVLLEFTVFILTMMSIVLKSRIRNN